MNHSTLYKDGVDYKPTQLWTWMTYSTVALLSSLTTQEAFPNIWEHLIGNNSIFGLLRTYILMSFKLICSWGNHWIPLFNSFKETINISKWKLPFSRPQNCRFNSLHQPRIKVFCWIDCAKILSKLYCKWNLQIFLKKIQKWLQTLLFNNGLAYLLKKIKMWRKLV